MRCGLERIEGQMRFNHLGRREFVTLLGGAAAWPLAARAQQSEPMRRIGVLINLAESDPEGQARLAALREGLQKLGWTEGRNIQIDYRWTAGVPERAHAYAAELVALKPEVIFAAATSVVAPLQRETRTVPIVFAQVADPVGAGLVASLARPGGNITGFANFEFAIGAKWLELLKQIAPSVVRVAVIYDMANPESFGFLPMIEAAARSFGVQIFPTAVRDSAGIERTIDTLAREPNGGLIPLPGPLIAVQREMIIALANRHRLPNVYAFRYYTVSGGLASYGVDNIDNYRRAADYVDRILKGEKPADLPVQAPTKYELTINLKTAKALGLDVPATVLARADAVIE
jgi:putative tryptophan/tyrosine transport system substrate-binding protein